MYKYYDMKLVTFSIDQNRNLMIQFSVFMQPYKATDSIPSWNNSSTDTRYE